MLRPHDRRDPRMSCQAQPVSDRHLLRSAESMHSSPEPPSPPAGALAVPTRIWPFAAAPKVGGGRRHPRLFLFVVALVVACCAVIGDLDGAVAAEVSATAIVEGEVTRPDGSDVARSTVVSVRPEPSAGDHLAPLRATSTEIGRQDAPRGDDPLGRVGGSRSRRGPPQG